METNCQECRFLKLNSCLLNKNKSIDCEYKFTESNTKAIPQKYAHINFNPPQSVIDIARRALNKIYLAGEGLEQQTKIWVRKVSQGESITPEKARQGYRWFARNNRFKDAPKDSPAWIAYLFWFGEPGRQWFNKLWKQLELADKSEK